MIILAIQNVFEIDVDIKQKTAIRTPTVTQNDAVVFIFRVFDEGRIYNIQEGTAFTMTCIRADKQSVVTAGMVKETNVVEFKLGTTEISVEGKVQAVIQVYDVEGRVSTIPFTFTVIKDPTEEYIPSETDKTLIQQVLGEGPAILADAEQATIDANQAADRANQAASDVEDATQGALEATDNANQAATNADEMALLAEQKANEASLATEGANTAKTEAETATQEAHLATEAINLVLPNVLNLEYIALYNATTQYLKNNIVRLGKNSYIALQDSKGKEPTGTTDSQYWGVLAVGGLDGTGSVVSVNGVSPDENGNVTLVIPDPDISGLATKNELTTLENKVTLHLAEDASLSEKGHVQLSNATNSTSESLAATPKAVKAAMDKANEAFMLGNSTKKNVVDKLLLADNSLPITNESTWAEIINQIPNISSGALKLIEAGDTGTIYRDTTSTSQSVGTIMTKIKEVILNAKGSGRVSVTFRSSATNRTAQVQIYKNGIPISGTTETTTTERIFTFDTNFVVGDKIQVYARIIEANATVYLNDFLINFDASTIAQKVL